MSTGRTRQNLFGLHDLLKVFGGNPCDLLFSEMDFSDGPEIKEGLKSHGQLVAEAKVTGKDQEILQLSAFLKQSLERIEATEKREDDLKKAVDELRESLCEAELREKSVRKTLTELRHKESLVAHVVQNGSSAEEVIAQIKEILGIPAETAPTGAAVEQQ